MKDVIAAEVCLGLLVAPGLALACACAFLQACVSDDPPHEKREAAQATIELVCVNGFEVPNVRLKYLAGNYRVICGIRSDNLTATDGDKPVCWRPRECK